MDTNNDARDLETVRLINTEQRIGLHSNTTQLIQPDKDNTVSLCCGWHTELQLMQK
jgi:hypothetical protein